MPRVKVFDFSRNRIMAGGYRFKSRVGHKGTGTKWTMRGRVKWQLSKFTELKMKSPLSSTEF
jgi:hypothetical protein